MTSSSSLTIHDFLGVYFDIDGTMCDTKRQVHPDTEAAIKLIQEHGLHAGVCTGRSFTMAKKEGIIDLFKPHSLHVCCGGSVVMTSEGRLIWKKAIPAEICHTLAEAAERYKSGYIFKSDDKMYANTMAQQIYGQVTDRYKNIFQPISDIPDDQWEALSLVVLEPTTPMRELMKTYSHIVTQKEMAFYNDGLLIDITAQNVTKAAGIRHLGLQLGLPPHKLMGFGDSDNDLEFFDKVGWSVAMGNALDSLKAIANRVIDHTDNRGLAQYIQAIVKGEPL